MSFSEILKNTVDKVDGAVSAMIIGTDGISVQEHSTEQLVDLTDLSAEASQMIKDISLAADNLGLGEAKEFSIISDRCGIIIMVVRRYKHSAGILVRYDRPAVHRRVHILGALAAARADVHRYRYARRILRVAGSRAGNRISYGNCADSLGRERVHGAVIAYEADLSVD